MNTHAPLRVLHVIPTCTPGGAQSVTRELLRLGEQDETLSCMLCVLGARREVNAFAEWTGPVEFLGTSFRPLDIVALARCARALRARVAAFQPDLVHSHLWPAALVSALACAPTPALHVGHIHDMRPWLSSRRWRHRGQHVLYRKTLRKAHTHLLAVSHAVKEHTAAHLPWPVEDIRVVPNGIDIAPFAEAGLNRAAPLTHRPAVIGTAGRLTAEKGCAVLLKAMARLRDEGVAAEARFAGVGSQQDALQHLARDLDLGASVLFLGHCKDMPSFYRALDVFVLPSLTEGLPVTLLEAMAAGRPVIVTRVGGAAEVLVDGRDGILVPPGDADALAKALARLIRDPAQRNALAVRGQQRVRADFTAERMARDVTAFYRSLLPSGLL